MSSRKPCSEKTKSLISATLKAKGIKPVKPNPFLGGEKHPNWKGGVIYNNGYKLIKCPDPNHPHLYRGGYVYEHRFVVEQHIGRYLEKTEKVHHKDGDITNNSIDNLVLCHSNSDHFKRFHVDTAMKSLQHISKERKSQAPSCPYCNSTNTNSSGINYKCRDCRRSWRK